MSNHSPVNRDEIIKNICPPLDNALCEALIRELSSLEKRYVLSDWEPATLDGGQFAEIGGRLLYGVDKGDVNRTKDFGKCLDYIEADSNKHSFPSRKDALLLCRILRLTYKFRSGRGAVHISLNYTANHADARLVIECCKWFFVELLRIFWTADRKVAEIAARNIVEYEVPAVARHNGQMLVQRVDCTVDEEILLLLHASGEAGLSRNELGKFIPKPPSTVSGAIKKLQKNRQILEIQSKRYKLIDLGMRRIMTELAEKLTIVAN